MSDLRVLALVNNVTKTSFQSELSAKIDATTDVDVAIASLYGRDETDIEVEGGIGDTEFIPLAADGRFDRSAYRKLRSAAKRFDILHTHYNFSGSMARTVCSLSDIKIVNTEHADHRYYSLLQRLVNVPSFAFADVMVFNSWSTRDSLPWYERVLIDDSSNHVIYNGIDMDRIDRAKSLSKPELPDSPVILSAGRMVGVKNLDTLVRALASLLEEHPDASLVLIGDGPERSKLKRLSRDLGIESRVHFPGYLSREQVYSAMHRADIFAVPSYREGFCNAAVEAMSCGLPVIASDIPVLHEVVGEGGRFVNSNEPESISTVLQRLLADDEMRAQLGQAVKTRARETFPIERTVEEYVNIYRDVLSE